MYLYILRELFGTLEEKENYIFIYYAVGQGFLFTLENNDVF